MADSPREKAAVTIETAATYDEEMLEKEVRIAELLARRAEARLRQLEAERKRSDLLRARRSGAS